MATALVPAEDLLSSAPPLLTDLYELTMGYGYWKSGLAETEAVFHLLYRKNPFGGGFVIACGLAPAVACLERWGFGDRDLEYLRGLAGNDGRPLFSEEFLEYLRGLRFECDVDAIPEGTVVFPQEPLVRVQGPIIQSQIVETVLLNQIGFPSLVATKAARVCLAARGDPVFEFGLRRAQGMDGALSASRAAYVGGCVGTSNLEAGRRFGIPVMGTHAHSWVMAFSQERGAFDAWARAMPNNGVFLVDTYDSLEGVRRATQAGRWLREHGYELAGIRLDSGDLAYLSQRARRILDEAGFPEARIVASNELDETIIASLKEQGAAISVWGVGTKLATAFDEPALATAYKLSAVRRPPAAWEYRVKLSEQAVKTSTPGILQVARFWQDNEFAGDMIYDEQQPPQDESTMIDPLDSTRRKTFPSRASRETLLVPIFRAGKRVYAAPPLGQTRRRAREQLDRLHPGVKRFVHPHRYPVGLDKNLHERRTALILQARGLAR